MVPSIVSEQIRLRCADNVYRLIDPADAKALTVPIYSIASSGESENVLSEFAAALPEGPRARSKFERFSDMHHGFMGARYDPLSSINRQRFGEGFQRISLVFKGILRP